MKWTISYLGAECELYQPKTLAKNELDDSGPYKVYGANGVIGRHSQFNHAESQLLIGCRGSCGVVNVSEPQSWINGNAMVVKPKSTKLDVDFLRHFLGYTDLSKAITGASQPQITRQTLSPIQIPIPPLAEQQRIAELLDTADRILKQRESAIAKLDQLAQSVFVEMFGSINGNEKKFKQMKLTEFFKFKTGKLDSNAAIENGIYPFFTCSKEDFAINEYAFDEEALLLAGNNATADYSVKHYKGKFNAYQRTYVINLADSNNSYAYAKACLQLKLIQLKSVSKGTNTKYLTMGIFREMTMNVPPKNLQIDFEKRIHAIDSVKSKNNEDLNILKKLKDSLYHQSFAVN
jgi:type I restriction enzyme S subunit